MELRVSVLVRGSALLLCSVMPAGTAAGQVPGSAFTFSWGATLREVQASAAGTKAEEPGPVLRVSRDGIEYLYYFYQPRRIRTVEIEMVVEEGKRVPRYGRTIFEPDGNKDDARLYSVSIAFPPLPFSGELPAPMVAAYGKPGNLTGTSIDLENMSTRVRVYLETYKTRRYLKRFVFTSREETARISGLEKALRDEESRRIKEELDRAAKTDSGTTEPGRRPGPTGLRSELIVPSDETVIRVD